MRLQKLALGGTAVGTGINTSPDFGERVCARLARATGVRFMPMENLFRRSQHAKHRTGTQRAIARAGNLADQDLQ